MQWNVQLLIRARPLAAVIGLILCVAGQAGRAQSAPWPEKPVTWVVGFAPGGATDVLARVLAARVGPALGRSVNVENKSGANGNLAAEGVVRSAADGYTQLVGTSSNAINVSLYKKLSFDLRSDLEPVAMLASTANVLVVNPGVLPVSSVSELIANAKAHPGKLSYASSGSGSSIHLSAELFKQQAMVHIVHIPYRGSAPAMTDLLSGQVHLMFDNLPSALPHIRAGRLRAIGVTSGTRSSLAPDIPTLAESGLPGFKVEPWFALFVPKGTSPAVRSRMVKVVEDALRQPEVRSRLAELGLEPGTVPPSRMGAFLEAEVARWADAVKHSGAVVE